MCDNFVNQKTNETKIEKWQKNVNCQTTKSTVTMNEYKENFEKLNRKSSLQHNDAIILYVMVVGFHHKKGCLIDFCYPPIHSHSQSLSMSCDTSNNTSNSQINQPLEDQGSHEQSHKIDCSTIKLPELWKSLPSLAIPDGAHNFEHDTVYFHLPSLDDPSQTVFGVACYQQIMTKMLLVRTPDMTRSSVQKSVVVLLRAPLYGVVERKLRIITRNYFQERDFSKTQILQEFYHSMVLQLKPTMIKTNEIYHGLSLKTLFSKFGQQVIVLFKLLLLEKKTLFIMSPIRDLSTSILALCSLFPGLLQEGLSQSHLLSEIAISKNFDIKNHHYDDPSKIKSTFDAKATVGTVYCGNNYSKPKTSITKLNAEFSSKLSYDNDLGDKTEVDLTMDMIADMDDESYSESRIASYNQLFHRILVKPYEYYGLPLQLFKCHSYCLPYCSISCFECLNNPNVRSCLAGSANSIFQRWENDMDVFVVDNQVMIENPQLKRILTPTVGDLRFISFLIRSINPSMSMDSSEQNDQDKRYQPERDEYEDFVYNQENQQLPYKGSDAWCRYHFKNYLLHMLRCSLLDESSKGFRSFNARFMSEWKQSYNYKYWLNNKPHIKGLFTKEIEAQHPFAANRLNDIRFKITNFFTNRQEHINNVSKVVLNTAKSTFSSWMSSLGTYGTGRSIVSRTIELANQFIEDFDDQEITSALSLDLDIDESQQQSFPTEQTIYINQPRFKAIHKNHPIDETSNYTDVPNSGFNLDESDTEIERETSA